MKRELGRFERALVISDQHVPFHIVSVLRLENAPPPHILSQSLKVLQSRHPFLRVRLLKEKGRYYFAGLVDPGLPFHVLPRWNDEHWMPVAEVELGTRIDARSGPLFRCTYLYDPTHRRGEIILAFSHAIADAFAVSRFIHDLLTTCASVLDGKTVSVYQLLPSPPAEFRFPSAFRGLRLTLHELRYALRLMADEAAYRLLTRGERIPPVHASPAPGHLLSMQLSEEVTESLAQRLRKEGLTLNSALNAAMMIAVNRHLYAGRRVPMRTITFANLRPYVKPALDVENLACYVSLLRYTVRVEGGDDLWELARRLHRKIDSSFKSGDEFAAAMLAEPLMQRVTRSKSFRMSATALAYNGVVPVQPEYGEIKVAGLYGFVSVFDLGPEFYAQGHIFDNRLQLDFMYLDADMSREEAKAIAEEIRSILQLSIRGERERGPGTSEAMGAAVPPAEESPEKTLPLDRDQPESSR